jgi:hypothetical protein
MFGFGKQKAGADVSQWEYKVAAISVFWPLTPTAVLRAVKQQGNPMCSVM